MWFFIVASVTAYVCDCEQNSGICVDTEVWIAQSFTSDLFTTAACVWGVWCFLQRTITRHVTSKPIIISLSFISSRWSRQRRGLLLPLLPLARQVRNWLAFATCSQRSTSARRCWRGLASGSLVMTTSISSTGLTRSCSRSTQRSGRSLPSRETSTNCTWTGLLTCIAARILLCVLMLPAWLSVSLCPLCKFCQC